jgi:hypothetical protein
MDAIFTHALQVETALLQAQHPILAEVIARGHALLMDGKVFPLEDGKSAVVGSSTNALLSYHVNGTCTCKAHEFRAEPCKHRMALLIDRNFVASARIHVVTSNRSQPVDSSVQY